MTSAAGPAALVFVIPRRAVRGQRENAVLPACDDVAPWKPVREEVREQVPFAHDDEPLLVDVAPFGAVVVRAWVQARPEHVVPETDVAVFPRGPVDVPVCEVPKAEAVPVESASEKANAVSVFMRR